MMTMIKIEIKIEIKIARQGQIKKRQTFDDKTEEIQAREDSPGLDFLLNRN